MKHETSPASRSRTREDGQPQAQPRVVIVGAGFGGLEAAKSLRRVPVQVTVIDRRKPLPGLSPVAMQEGRYVAQVIAGRVEGFAQPQPFRYHDKGTLATVGCSFAVVDIGPLHFTGLFAWLTWIVVHIFYLIGFRNRLLVMIRYAWAYVTFQPGARIILPEEHASLHRDVAFVATERKEALS
jgi:NADH dehydrogenase FAD-containing subunit